MARRSRRYWLMKSEPGTYSIQDLERDGQTMWEGVRNYQARNFMRDDLAVGDLALFYHSSAKPMGVAGISRVCRAAYPDPTQFEPKSPYYDASSDPADPRWQLVDVEYVETFAEVLPLSTLKADDELGDMLVVQRGQRLSVQPVDKADFQHILKLAKAKTKLR
jgi:predicted RNA-binding protein with PUA-like domain